MTETAVLDVEDQLDARDPAADALWAYDNVGAYSELSGVSALTFAPTTGAAAMLEFAAMDYERFTDLMAAWGMLCPHCKEMIHA